MVFLLLQAMVPHNGRKRRHPLCKGSNPARLAGLFSLWKRCLGTVSDERKILYFAFLIFILPWEFIRSVFCLCCLCWRPALHWPVPPLAFPTCHLGSFHPWAGKKYFWFISRGMVDGTISANSWCGKSMPTTARWWRLIAGNTFGKQKAL